MPQFFFHLRDGTDVLLDPEGRPLDGPDSVARLALKEARTLIGQEALDGRIHLDQRIEVEDSEGRIVHSVEFVDAVEIVGGRS